MTKNSGARILLVDDDLLVSETLSAILQRAGYVITTATNGDAGLKELQSREFDLVITDIMMPRMDGIEAILAIRRRNPSQKIIAISGGSLEVDLDYLKYAEKLGADGILYKPINTEQLLAMVGPLLQRPA
ncbi:MAG: response regulator [Alphaproteobacteria bacterium]|nr:response regulator [Alphaproteobacteria bacterium]MBL6955075.1 response regulator [Alphaproteobacteria bacterium]